MALTNRAFERTPTAKLGNRPVTDDELVGLQSMAEQRSRSLRSLSVANARNPIKSDDIFLANFVLLLFIVLILSSPSLAARVERLIDTWQPQHYLVNITLNDQLSEITSASARIDVKIVKPTREIDLDFGDLTVDRVTLNAKPITFTHKPRQTSR